MMLRALLLLLFLAGCGRIPQDPHGTLDRIRADRAFKAGIIAAAPPHPAQHAMVRRIERATGARASIEHGSLETLLVRLEEGRLDLVVGEISPGSPWSKRVTLLPPLAERVTPDGHAHISAVVRNGENRWIALLHREARHIRART